MERYKQFHLHLPFLPPLLDCKWCGQKSKHLLFESEGGVHKQCIFFPGGGPGSLQTNCWEIKTCRSNTTGDILQSNSGLSVRLRLCVCVVRRKSCTRFICRWNYTLACNCFPSITLFSRRNLGPTGINSVIL